MKPSRAAKYLMWADDCFSHAASTQYGSLALCEYQNGMSWAGCLNLCLHQLNRLLSTDYVNA